ncbi:D-aminoacyl-tRNA deacylase [Phanerochaete sordida]|uniref:D-aminoacyl-tRNA deacylase n=1 Tax=Phanerochaete sordida TaxID=48140 RepID=A0A9P3L9A3_9APHY|nr:D-aminoacyl-tRNA deacylase [Phanerochaete sordida]
MRAVVQRVTNASVVVDNEVISSIGRGLMVLVGIGTDDTAADMTTLTNKILSLKVFEDADGRMWKSSVKDIDGEVLCVSQFTLFANTSKGNKPDFHRAMSSESSKEMYASFLDRMRSLYKPEKIQDGRFGAMMNVSLTNEGPVTFTLDSRKFEYVDQPSSGTATPAKKGKKSDAANDAREGRSGEPEEVLRGERE